MHRKDYDDMIHLPRPVSTKHPPMRLVNRAAQFAPFAALAGFGTTIVETARRTEEEIRLAEDAAEVIDRKLRILHDKIKEQPEVLVTYFKADEKKNGGAYVCIPGKVKKIDIDRRRLVFDTGEAIGIDDIFEVESPAIDEMLWEG